MLSALKLSDHRFFHSDPFAPFNDMESEIAELRTMTRVTKLRQQIECRQEGAWMTVRDVPDDKGKGGTRKVTSYGRASRSVTRSFTSNLDFGNFIDNGPASSSTSHHDVPREEKYGVIVEFPDEHATPAKPSSGVEITDVTENDPKSSETSEPSEFSVLSKSSPTKKTSVVTLGQGNVVLIDPQDSNFKVTGFSKEHSESDVGAEKPSNDKKIKKVGFSKTEVHFAPDSGKVNIVETDEKPPSTQLLRRKKKIKRESPSKTTMPKLYFGDVEQEKFLCDKVSKGDVDKIVEHVFPVIREPSPLLSTGITSQARELKEPWTRKNSKFDDLGTTYAVPKKSQENVKRVDINLGNVEDKVFKIKNDMVKDDTGHSNRMPYLGNVSPKLSKLISNDIQHEFQLKQMQILRQFRDPDLKEESREASPDGDPVTESARSPEPVDAQNIPIAVNVHVTAGDSVSTPSRVKPVKVVTQMQVSLQDKGVAPEPRTKRIVSEPIYVNNASSKSVTRTIKITREDDKIQKPRSSVTKIVADDTKERKRTRSFSKQLTPPERVRKTPSSVATESAVTRKTPTPKPKDTPKREVAVVKPMKPYARNTSTRLNEPCKRSKTSKSEDVGTRVSKISRNASDSNDAKAKKTKEPLRSFEKVSNGWVGHCIVPVKTQRAGSKISVTTTATNSTAPLVTSSKTSGVKRDKGVESKPPLSSTVRIENESRSSFSANKQFSLSKEHLKSAKLVKELYKSESKTEAARPRTATASRIQEKRAHKSLVSRRRLVYEDGTASSAPHVRRDSEQSDDSVVRADEEVRAYMFNTKTKVQFDNR